MDSQPIAQLNPMDATVRLLNPFSGAPRLSEAGPPDWQAAWRFCGFHGVRPALAQALERLPDLSRPPPWLVGDLTDFTRAHAFAVMQKTAEIVLLSKVLEAEGVTSVFFKGAVLGEQVYGAAQFREFNDIDLLVSFEDRDRVADLLEASGYFPVIVDRLFRSAFFDYVGQHMFRNRDSGSVVDLHWNFVGNLDFPVDAAEVLRNRTMLVLGGARVPVPSIEDLALILAGHGQKEGWASFGWALDFAKFAASFPDFDWARTARRAQGGGALGSLLTALLLVERLFDHALDQELVAKARQRQGIVKEVERIVAGYLALAERRLADDLMGSFRLCETPFQRARVWWGLITTRTIGDYDALPLPPRWWWVYRLTRPFRLAWQRFRAQPPTPSASFEGHKKT